MEVNVLAVTKEGTKLAAVRYSTQTGCSEDKLFVFSPFMHFLPAQKWFGVKLKGLLKVRNPLGLSPLPLNSPLPQSLNYSSAVCYNIWPVRSSGWETNITAASFSSRFDDKWGCSLAALLTRLHSHSRYVLFMGPPPCRRDCYADVCCLPEMVNTVMLRSSHIKSVSSVFLTIWDLDYF